MRYAKAGENVKLQILNITDENLINRGDVLCKMGDNLPVSDLFEAELDLLELLEHKPLFSKGYQFMLHLHTITVEA